MSILEVLEKHHEWDVDIDYTGGNDTVTCPCGWRERLALHAGNQHRAHVAQMLEQDVTPTVVKVTNAGQFDQLPIGTVFFDNDKDFAYQILSNGEPGREGRIILAVGIEEEYTLDELELPLHIISHPYGREYGHLAVRVSG